MEDCELCCSSVEEVVEMGYKVGYPILLRGRGGRDAGRVIDELRSAASEHEARGVAKFMFAQHKLLLPIRKKRLQTMTRRRAQKNLSAYEMHEVEDEIKSLKISIESLKIFVSSSSMKAKMIREYGGSTLWDPNLCLSYMPCDHATAVLRAAYTADVDAISTFPLSLELWQDLRERQEKPRQLAPRIERLELDLIELKSLVSSEEIQQKKIESLAGELDRLKGEQLLLEADSQQSVTEVEDMKQKNFAFPKEDIDEHTDTDKRLQDIEEDKTLTKGQKRVAQAKVLQEKLDYEDRKRHPASRQTSLQINLCNNQFLRWMPIQLSASKDDVSSFSRLLDLGAYVATDDLLAKTRLNEEKIKELQQENQNAEMRIHSLQTDILVCKECIEGYERSMEYPNISPAQFSEFQSELRIGRERCLNLQRGNGHQDEE
eukprot:768405-Hanusia_phi.AAC.4